MSREPVPVGCGSKGTRTVLLGDKVIRCVNASLPAPAAVVEEEALEVAVSHLSPKRAQERKKDALAMEQTRCRRQNYFTHRRPSFIRDRFLSERWRRRAWRAIYPGDSCGSTEGRSPRLATRIRPKPPSMLPPASPIRQLPTPSRQQFCFCSSSHGRRPRNRRTPRWRPKRGTRCNTGCSGSRWATGTSPGWARSFPWSPPEARTTGKAASFAAPSGI